MTFDKELWLTIGGATVAAVIGWQMGSRMAKTMNKMQRDMLILERHIIELEGKEQLRTAKEEHEVKKAAWLKKIADTQSHLADLKDQTKKDLEEQAKFKKMFENNELTPEQYAEKLMKYVP